MSDSLSQDQIDALLSQTGLDGSESAEGVGEDSLRDAESNDYEALARGLDLYRDQAAKVITTLLNKQVSFEARGNASRATTDLVAGTLGAPALGVAIPFESGLSGVLQVLLSRKAAACLSDLMMMGDGSAEFADEHKDAVGEIFNQVTGSFNTAFAAASGDKVGIGRIDVLDFDPRNPPLDMDTCDTLILTMKPEGLGDHAVVLLVPEELSRQIQSKMGGGANRGGGPGNVGLNQAELDDLSKVTMDMGMDGGGSGFRESSLAGPAAPQGNVNMLLDVELDVCIELGRANLSVKRVLELAPGSIVELDRMAGEPVDLLVNNKVVAKGEVVVVDENFGIRIVSLVSPEERIKSLR